MAILTWVVTDRTVATCPVDRAAAALL